MLVEEQHESPSFLSELLRGPARTLLPLLLGWALAAGIIIVPATDITADYFASALPGYSAHAAKDVVIGICPAVPAAEHAEACAEAASRSVTVSGYTGAAGALVTFLISPGLGRMSDILGRRPFVLVTFVLPLLSTAALAGHYASVKHLWPIYVDLWIYLVLKPLSTTIPITMGLAYFADAFSPANRATGFGIVLATLAAAIIIGPKLGSLLHEETALWVALGLALCGYLIGVVVLKETVTPAQRSRARELTAVQRSTARVFMDSVSILLRDRFFAVLALVATVDALALQGLMDVGQFYLKDVLHMSATLRGYNMQASGFAGLFVQCTLLKAFVRYLGERNMLFLGLLSTTAFIFTQGLLGQLFMGQLINEHTAWTLLFACAVPAQAIAMITFPALSALKANHATSDEQGQVQGALNGARSLATGAGPLLTAQLWGALPQSPFVVYYVLAVAAFLSFLLAIFTLPRTQHEVTSKRLKQPLLGPLHTPESALEAGRPARRSRRQSAYRVGASDSNTNLEPADGGPGTHTSTGNCIEAVPSTQGQ